MSKYIRDLRSGSAILIDKDTDKVVASFKIEDYDYDSDKMRSACNQHWDKLDQKNKDDGKVRTLYLRKEEKDHLVLVNKETETEDYFFELSDYNSREEMYEACNLLWDKIEEKKHLHLVKN